MAASLTRMTPDRTNLEATPVVPTTPTVPHRHGGCRTGHRPPGPHPLVSPPSRVERAAPDPDVVALLGT
ncbi:MAG TPA: hypothetical protein VFY38_13340, partial [Pseudonocardia sp.]|nr:hypothetical protein [Pseudonocardia sp.]